MGIELGRMKDREVWVEERRGLFVVVLRFVLIDITFLLGCFRFLHTVYQGCIPVTGILVDLSQKNGFSTFKKRRFVFTPKIRG